ncbi:hypothetical protein QCA50_006848 [Cerrena zonata]|uniref:Uncharacterized protein n=1 Tax=Cerrena zonata TaxID=2478898 RepID=A0AAW0GF14_9APHY
MLLSLLVFGLVSMPGVHSHMQSYAKKTLTKAKKGKVWVYRTILDPATSIRCPRYYIIKNWGWKPGSGPLVPFLSAEIKWININFRVAVAAMSEIRAKFWLYALWNSANFWGNQ